MQIQENKNWFYSSSTWDLDTVIKMDITILIFLLLGMITHGIIA